MKSMRRTIEERMVLPLDGDPDAVFYSKEGLVLARGYTRIVLGGRGPYIEFSSDQIVHENIYIPDHARHKLQNSMAYYHEYRSKDDANVKLYDQKMCVSYADYIVGMWYISPNLVRTDEFEDLVLPLYPTLIETDVSENQNEDRRNILDAFD